MDDLISRFEKQGILKTPQIIEALRTVDRYKFVAPDYEPDASLNEPLPIGYGQTISQPMTVGFMLELLQAGDSDKVLDVGAGSGWTAALLARLVGPNGKVYAMERIPQLKHFCESNLRAAGIEGVEVVLGDGSRGLPSAAPFDRIHVAAAAAEVPAALIKQLAIGGRLVVPVGQYVQEVILIEKVGQHDIREQRYPGFQFVPLITEVE